MTMGHLIDPLVYKLTSWPKHTLSCAGKFELVKMVLQEVECFWLSILLIPCGVINKTYTISCSFVWSTKHLPSWSTMCLAVEEGGYGVCDLKAWNSSLLRKVLWCTVEKGLTLDAWIHHQYLS